MRLRSAMLAFAGFLALAACSNDDDREETPFQQATEIVRDRLTPGEPGPTLRDGLTRAQIQQLPGEVIFVEIPDRDAQALMGLLIETPNGATYVTPEGITLTFEQGFLKASRGLGGDIVAGDSRAIRAALGTEGTAIRFYDYLTGEDRIDRRRLTCLLSAPEPERITVFEVVYGTARIDETCSDGELVFDNVYWIDEGGVVRKSRQFVSLSVGHVIVEQL
ncbi:YjbF family lipoprotein [Aestuariibius sp. 2305UL40-4]|uniref:YjbF family lipoprotein n=1 Tax=Aestuariibius violaceus TaxID=3234132 RepID=UPI00345E2D96